MHFSLIVICLFLIKSQWTHAQRQIPSFDGLVRPCSFRYLNSDNSLKDDEGWFEPVNFSSGYCYKLFWQRDVTATWTGARFHCRNLSSHLLWFDTLQETNLFIHLVDALRLQMRGSRRSEIYMNTHRYIYNSSGAAWATGEPILLNQPGHTGELRCEEDDRLRKDCYTMNMYGYVVVRSCLDSLPARFICKKALPVQKGTSAKRLQAHSDCRLEEVVEVNYT